MACMEMHNSINGAATARISFSNEFVELRSEKNNGKSNNVHTRNSLSKPSADFEFSVTDYTMIPADEIFLKGKILPFKETSHVQRTLREELLVEEESPVHGNIFSLRPLFMPSSSFSTKGTWKELLGLKTAHVRSRKTDKFDEEEIRGSSQDHKTISGNAATRECRVGDTR